MTSAENGQGYFSPENGSFKVQRGPFEQPPQPSFLIDNETKGFWRGTIYAIAEKFRPKQKWDPAWNQLEGLHAYALLAQRELLDKLEQMGILDVIARETRTDIKLWRDLNNPDEKPRDKRPIPNPLVWDVDILAPRVNNLSLGNRCSDKGRVIHHRHYENALNIDIKRGKQGEEELVIVHYDSSNLLTIKGRDIAEIKIGEQGQSDLVSKILRDSLRNPIPTETQESSRGRYPRQPSFSAT